MKKKQVIIIAFILFFAIVIIWNGKRIESIQKSKNYKKLDKAVQSYAALESLLEEHMGGWSKYEGDGLDYVDEITFQKLKKIYEGIVFKGEFKTGDKEVYDYYREKYAKLLNGDVKIMDDEKREYSDGEEKNLEYYGYDEEGLEESNIYYFDMDEDGLPELCLSGYITYVFKYIPDTDEYRIWYANESMSSEISESRRISDSYVGNHSSYYSFYELNKNGDVEIRVDFGEEFYENEEYCYYVHLPEYEDKTREPKIQKELKKQKDDSKYRDYYAFRVTKKQYEELTKAYFDTEANVWKETVHMSYFYPEKERLYDSIFELPDNMTYADEQAFQRLKEIYENIDFYGEFNKGDPEAYEEYRKKYVKLLSGRAMLVDDYAVENNLEYSLEEYLGKELDKTSISLYYYDIDEDSLPELNIQDTFGSYIFKYNPKTQKHYLWSKKGRGQD